MDYPRIQLAADAASASTQKTFVRLNAALLGLLSVTAFISGWNPREPGTQRGVAIAVFVLMLLALGITTWLRLGKHDDRWFRCRAFAENVKSAVWYFVMSSSVANVAEKDYLQNLDEVQERLSDIRKDVAFHNPDGPRVTESMRQAHALSFRDKLSLYRNERVADQAAWYQSKAEFNISRERAWFAAVFVIEFLAVGYAALQIARLWEFNAVGGVVAVASALIAWIQIKRFSDLGTSYAIAADDLRRIADKRASITTEPELQELVREVEQAVSREHSFWLSRRVNY